MTAAKWENRFHKQVEVNNLMSDKLRKTREVGQNMIDALRQAYIGKVDEIKDLKYQIQTMEAALLKEVSGNDDTEHTK